MRDSDLGTAEARLEQLRGRRFDAIAVINRLFSDQLPPAALSDVPSGLYQGFLRNLRSQL